MKSVRFSLRSIPIAFAVVTVAAYGLLVPLTGFYWDDWPFAWTARFLGPAAFIPAFRGFRPFLGPIFFLTTSVIPPNPLLWQISALLVHFLAAWAAWAVLDQVWPKHRRETLAGVLLFLVYPGYSQHWVAFTHVNQEWIPLIFYLLSFGFSLRVVRSARSALASTLLALLFLFVGLFPTEYFIGLEPLRLMFFWVIAAESQRGFIARSVRALRSWWPYCLVWTADLAWLAYYYRSGVYVSYDVAAAAGLPSFAGTLSIFADAVWKAGLYSWLQVILLVAKSISAPSTLLTLGLVVLAFAAAALYLLRLRLDDHPTERLGARTRVQDPAPEAGSLTATFAIPAILIGLVGILLGRIPSFAAGLPLTLQSSFDRFMISMMLGGSLFVTGLITLVIRSQRARTYTFAALLALGVGQQFFNANIFRRDWQGQQQIYWQLAWRIPALQPGTALVTQQMPLDYETDLSMTAALDWIFATQRDPASLPYALVYSEKRLGGAVLPSLNPGTPMKLSFRTVSFTGNTSSTITIYVPRNGCLRVLDPDLGDLETYAGYPASVTSTIPLSDPSRIVPAAPTRVLPSPPFDKEAPHAWCYFYEKAELARQTGDWQQVVSLGSEAAQEAFSPQDAIEWLPFIEAYARAGDLPLAERISRQAWSEAPKVHHGLCIVWGRLQSDGPDAARNAATQLIGEFGCGH